MTGKRILAFTGGVGGAKLALGLSTLLGPEELAFVVNTGDDFRHLGFPVSHPEAVGGELVVFFEQLPNPLGGGGGHFDYGHIGTPAAQIRELESQTREPERISAPYRKSTQPLNTLTVRPDAGQTERKSRDSPWGLLVGSPRRRWPSSPALLRIASPRPRLRRAARDPAPRRPFRPVRARPRTAVSP